MNPKLKIGDFVLISWINKIVINNEGYLVIGIDNNNNKYLLDHHCRSGRPVDLHTLQFVKNKYTSFECLLFENKDLKKIDFNCPKNTQSKNFVIVNNL